MFRGAGNLLDECRRQLGKSRCPSLRHAKPSDSSGCSACRAVVTPAPVRHARRTPSQPEHLAPTKTHQCRCFGYLDPAIRQIVQHAHPVDLRPTHRNHRHRPNAPQLKLRRVTSLSGPTVTSLSGVYMKMSPIDCYGTSIRPSQKLRFSFADRSSLQVIQEFGGRLNSTHK